MTVQRWTSASVMPSDAGGFVSYGDYLTEIENKQQFEQDWLECCNKLNNERRVHLELEERMNSPAGGFIARPVERRVSRHPWKRGNTEKEITMRELNEHKINPGNDTLKITVIDEPGHGGANHAYDIEGGEAVPTHLRFQNGPISADGNGVNGITHEALLAVLCDRLRGFQAGPYACKANACALTHLEEAQHWLQQRTIERMRRGVEGTHTV